MMHCPNSTAGLIPAARRFHSPLLKVLAKSVNVNKSEFINLHNIFKLKHDVKCVPLSHTQSSLTPKCDIWSTAVQPQKI